MKKKIKRDPDKPIGKLRVVPDFLPSPEELFPKSEVQKITILVDKNTVLFFKNTASQHGQKYQRMMREVLKGYAKKYGT
ncbi:MAG: CopG family transcriptional regulator [Deltaproteobacteria bacterium]|nr:CopG family transcriptional regulator [Deltaproteobacteria bacterium]